MFDFKVSFPSHDPSTSFVTFLMAGQVALVHLDWMNWTLVRAYESWFEHFMSMVSLKPSGKLDFDEMLKGANLFMDKIPPL